MKLEKYNKKNLTTKEELELFRIFNGCNKSVKSSHVNFVSVTNGMDFDKNFYSNREKAIEYIQNLKKDK